MKKVLIISLFGAFLSLVNLNSVFAEDDLLCKGRIKGETTVDAIKWNPNSGISTFNDAGDLKLVDLSVMGLEMGYAPSREAAACTIDRDDLQYEPIALGVDEFGVQGFAWNTNLGFISMYCDGAASPYKNLGFDCGTFKYGVKVGADIGGGVRELKGYAYNDVFGYINFSCKAGLDALGNACGGIDYGVTRAADGSLSGHAYTSAGVYMAFEGVTMGLPDDLVEIDGWCNNKPYVCVEIKPDPKTLDYTLSGGYKLANGKDGYEVNVYLKDKNGNYDPTLYDEAAFIESLNFVWEDTVKLDQLAAKGEKPSGNFNTDNKPYEGGVGGIVYKPINNLKNGVDFTDDGKGHFTLNNLISSYAPSSDGNV